ncbi:hypothetical protein QA640_17880 [Bradyrhizobium sp. CB82]|uniref:hypothetical protein n=1 Tax=Bradyrhizobium sp. CB82 TaxID=3039159 RepID=UPI0024B227EB|nr:hypothetical protein [Bradyrhizobium sp. CB82]WFU44151.1 hypothetical protein QA640_17880 [Bradyrhizobium sp. CB82]
MARKTGNLPKTMPSPETGETQGDWYDKGVPAQTVRPWQSYLKTLQSKMSELPEADRTMGNSVLEKFTQQCAHLSSVVIQVPAMRVTSSESFSAYDYNIDRHPVAVRAKAIANQIRKAQDDMQACFGPVATASARQAPGTRLSAGLSKWLLCRATSGAFRHPAGGPRRRPGVAAHEQYHPHEGTALSGRGRSRRAVSAMQRSELSAGPVGDNRSARA